MTEKPRYRPPKYRDPEEMQPKIDAYFDKCDAGRKVILTKGKQQYETHKVIPYTWVGLALALGFESRQSLWDYCNKNKHKDGKTGKAFSYIITCAKGKIEDQNLTGSALGEYDSKTMGLTLSANHGYAKRTEQDINIKGQIDLEARLLKAEKEADTDDDQGS